MGLDLGADRVFGAETFGAALGALLVPPDGALTLGAREGARTVGALLVGALLGARTFGELDGALEGALAAGAREGALEGALAAGDPPPGARVEGADRALGVLPLGAFLVAGALAEGAVRVPGARTEGADRVLGSLAEGVVRVDGVLAAGVFWPWLPVRGARAAGVLEPGARPDAPIRSDGRAPDVPPTRPGFLTLGVRVGADPLPWTDGVVPRPVVEGGLI